VHVDLDRREPESERVDERAWLLLVVVAVQPVQRLLERA